jgi:hypothetical protein
LTVSIVADEAVDVLVTAFMMFEVLFELEGLAAVFIGALKNSVR